MSRRQKIKVLLIAPISALLLLAVLYLLLLSQLPQGIVRHVGPQGVGYSPPGIVVGSMAAVAVLCFAVGAWTCLDFSSLGHWYPGPKSIVVCFLAGGYSVVVLAITTLFASLGPTASLDGSSLGYGLLALVLAFAAASLILVRVLPRALEEQTER